MASGYSKDLELQIQSKEQTQSLIPKSWDDCPNEILLMIVEKMNLSTTAICLFVNRKWNKACKYIISKYKLWHRLCTIYFPHNGQTLQEKSYDSSWYHIYRNSILWWHFSESASLSICQPTVEHNRVLKLNVYKDNLIVVNPQEVQYYGIHDLRLRKVFEISCIDFVENKSMIVNVRPNLNDLVNVNLLGKTKPDDDFDSNDLVGYNLRDAVFYRINAEGCYVLTGNGSLWRIIYIYKKWSGQFIARYYGSLDTISAFNVYDDHVYILTVTGAVLIADNLRWNKILEVEMPTRAIDNYMFHKFGFVFEVPGEKAVKYKRYNVHEGTVHALESPKLTSMLEHGDIILIGNSDGEVEFYRPRDLTTSKAVHVLSLKDYISNLQNPAVITMEVYEDKDTHRLFVATRSNVFHFKIMHTKYVWSEFPMCTEMILDFNIKDEM